MCFKKRGEERGREERREPNPSQKGILTTGEPRATGSQRGGSRKKGFASQNEARLATKEEGFAKEAQLINWGYPLELESVSDLHVVLTSTSIFDIHTDSNAIL